MDSRNKNFFLQRRETKAVIAAVSATATAATTSLTSATTSVAETCVADVATTTHREETHAAAESPHAAQAPAPTDSVAVMEATMALESLSMADTSDGFVTQLKKKKKKKSSSAGKTTVTGGSSTQGGDSRRRAPSYGLVPWTLVNGVWYILLQQSYSAKLFDFKLDPLRGEQEGNESEWEAACREAYEESEGVINLKSMPMPQWESDKDGLFHCQVVLESAEDLCDLVHAFRAAHPWPVPPGGKHGVPPETEGLAWVPALSLLSDADPPGIRIADQVIQMQKAIRPAFEKFERNILKTRLVHLKKVTSKGTVSFMHTAERKEVTPIVLPEGADKKWRASRSAQILTANSEYAWRRRAAQLRLYPQDIESMKRVITKLLGRDAAARVESLRE